MEHSHKCHRHEVFLGNGVYDAKNKSADDEDLGLEPEGDTYLWNRIVFARSL